MRKGRPKVALILTTEDVVSHLSNRTGPYAADR
jgi:hypothetical protein